MYIILYVCFVLMTAFILLNILFKNTLSFFVQELSKKKEVLKMADYCEVDIQKKRDSDNPAIIKTEVENFISWDFNETWVDSRGFI